MRKNVFMMAAALVVLTACEKVVVDPEGGTSEQTEQTAEQGKTKKFTFTLKGDFSNEWKPITRGYLQADGKDLTDVWVLDYDGAGNLLQQLHQDDNTSEDFGKPVLNLAYGQHHVYFIASRGQNPTLNTETKTISFTKVLDTFFKDYEVSVVSTSNGNRAVTLDRVVTRLRLTFTDAIPSNAATFNVAPAVWYYGWNYQTGAPAASASNQAVVVNIPSSSIGKTGEYVNVFGFSAATEWTTDINFNSKTSGGDVIGQATITAAPFVANRSTEYSGPLFGSPDSEVTMGLSTDWTTPVTGTW
jgi:hypothetical protein